MNGGRNYDCPKAANIVKESTSPREIATAGVPSSLVSIKDAKQNNHNKKPLWNTYVWDGQNQPKPYIPQIKEPTKRG